MTPPNTPLSSRTLTVTSTALPTFLGQPALVPTRLVGREALGELFDYTLDLKTPDSLNAGASLAANFKLNDLVGREISVAIELDGSGPLNTGQGQRQINALITAAHYLHDEGRHSAYRLTLRPWLHLATLTADCKIFQDQSVVELLDSLLADYPFAVEKRLSQSYPPRDYQTQYNETDYAFFARLCEEWGIAWWFEHSEGKHRLILADAPGAYRANPGAAYQQVNFYPPGHKIDEEYLERVQLSDTLTTGAWASTDTDYTRVRADLAVSRHDPRPTGHADQEIFTWPDDTSQPKAGAGGLAGQANDPLSEAAHFARVRLDALRAPGVQAHADGHLRGMVPGCTFTLDKHPADAANIEWLILDAQITIEEIAEESQSPGLAPGQTPGQLPGQQAEGTPGALAAGAASAARLLGQTWQIHTRLTLQPAKTPYHPPQRQPKPRTHGPQRATVTGPADKEIWTDAYARIKVAFPWDRYHSNDARSACWLRVSSPWAGSQFGGIHIPRIGQEVIVDFEAGDPDRPLITGRLINSSHLPPWTLPENQSLAGYRSKELYGQQHNHLILDDTEGEVQAQLSSDHALSQLNLGKVVRIPDTRGRQDHRGEGFELRTDAHGVLRAKDGLLLTTEARPNARSYIKSLGETTARLAAAQETQATLADLAKQHQAQEGDQQEAIAKVVAGQNKALQGSGTADAESGDFPEFSEPHLTLASPAGIQSTTAGSTHIASDEHLALTTGQSIGMAVGKGLFASVKDGVRLFVHQAGIKLVAAANDIEVKALSHSIHVLAKTDITHTATTIDIAAKTELLVNGGGSYTQFQAGSIEHGTPGTFTVHSATPGMPGAKAVPVVMPPMQKGTPKLILHYHYDTLEPLSGAPYKIAFANGAVREGVLDAKGRAEVLDPPEGEYVVELGEDPNPFVPPDIPEDKSYIDTALQRELKARMEAEYFKTELPQAKQPSKEVPS